MKRMIDNKEFNELKKDVKDVEAHTSDYIINQVVYDSEAEKVTGFVIKDVENSITYNVELGGGGKQLYQHNIFMQNNNDKKLTCQVTIINDSNVAFNYSTLAQWLNDNGFAYTNSTHKWYNAKGHFSSGTIMGIDFVENQNAIFALQLSADFSTQTESSISNAALTTIDTVISL